jgi:Fe-S cluster assembly ATP-binding protein
VHVLVKGRIVASGGPELADELEVTGYATYVDGDDADEPAKADDPFADPLA